MAIHVFGAIDVGSYELGLKIFEVSKARGIRQIDSIETKVDLGTDTYRTGKISAEHIHQLTRRLCEFHQIMKNYGVEEYKAYGTSAIREMCNSSIVLSRLEQETGIHIDVLSNSEQRFLDYKSVASHGEDFSRMISDSCAILDIGGGSIQLSLFNEERLSATSNMKLGILRLYDHLRKMNPRTSQIEMLVTEMVDSQLDSFKKLYLNKHKVKNIIVVDDYISQVMAAKKLEFVSTKEYCAYLESMRHANFSSASREIGILEENIPLLYVSAILLRRVIDTLGAEQIYVPGVTLCDGIVYEYAEKKKFITATHDFEADIIACTYNISKRYQGSMERSRTLQTICKRIFDATKKIHGMGHRDELLLDIACNLHDCGKYISLSNLAECSYNIIMSTEIIGLSHLEREIVANVVRFNHEDFVYFEDQQNLSDLDRNSYLTIAKLTAILRLANGLDRSHKQKFDDIRVLVREDTLLITVGEDVDITLEKGLYTERADFFEEIFGIRPVIRQKRSRR